MELIFEVIKNDVGIGSYPDVIHFSNEQAQLFNISEGELNGVPTDKIGYGEWGDVIFRDVEDVSQDTNMSHFEINVLPGFGIIGSYKSGDKHKLIIYEYAVEMGIFLESGSITHSIENSISTFDLSLENADLKNPERPGNFINETNSLISPGAKVSLYFHSGSDFGDNIPLGVFFVDDTSFDVRNNTASVNGRNTIGKILRDQTLDEHYQIGFKNVNTIMQELLELAKVERWAYLIGPTAKEIRCKFTPDTTFLEAMEEIFKLSVGWKIQELSDGTIVVGGKDYHGFEPNGVYTFYRDVDIFSRSVKKDDLESYRKVCVHTNDFTISVYADVKYFTGWNIQANKTFYVEMPDGITATDAALYAIEIATRLEKVGQVETFKSAFRPYISVGDEAVVLAGTGSQSIGLITEITHSFGRDGFSTEFTVDSGGKLGRGRLTDYIKNITKKKDVKSIGYD